MSAWHIVHSQQYPVYNEFNLYPLIESTHSCHHPYKSRQYFTHYSKLSDIQNECNHNIESTYLNSGDDQLRSKTIICRHPYLSQSISNLSEIIYQQNRKELKNTYESCKVHVYSPLFLNLLTF